MKNLSENTREFLLRLARDTIASSLNSKPLNIGDIPDEALAKAGTFVTLTKKGELRGCIGFIEPINQIYQGVIDNARSAAFHDPRFLEVGEDELSDVRIEISILSIPQKLEVEREDELLRILEERKPGLIIEKGYAKATFLPQVWEELEQPSDFLTHLCVKAGMSPDAWKQPSQLSIYAYEVEHFCERK